MKTTFLKVAETFNKSDSTPHDDLPFFRVDFQDKFSFDDFSADSIQALVTRLADDLPLAREFIFNKMGIDTQDAEQLKAGLDAYKWCRLISFSRTSKDAFLREADVHNTFCVMRESKTSEQLQACIDRNIEEMNIL